MPNRQVKSWHASLIHGRNVRRQRKPFRCGDRERLDLAIAQLLKGIPGLIEHEIDLPCDQILHGGRCPSIGHELNVRAGTTLEVRAKQPTQVANTPADALFGWLSARLSIPSGLLAGNASFASIKAGASVRREIASKSLSKSYESE
jgi:hypothetical protein